ncbi:MAG: hypothetical protein LAP85_06610 [Acidobacteriia bacterium]|nr:hypothetical protein [Terriglobia bacterium]
MRRSALALLLLVGAAVLASSASLPTEPAGKIDLQILYVGHPDSAREKDFVEFLDQHFSHIKTGDLAQFTPSSAEGSDVVLLDYDGDGFKSPHPELPSSYTKPTLTIGVTGGMISMQRGLKTGYM